MNYDIIKNEALFVNGYTEVDLNVAFENWRVQKLAILDVETNGFPFLNEWTQEVNPDFRILSFYCHVYEKRQHIDTIELLINPEMEIDPSSIKIHGITDEMVDGQPNFKDSADEIVHCLQQVDAIVAFNARFDIRALHVEFIRNKIDLINLPFIDLLVFERQRRGTVDKISTSRNKLSDIARRFGVSTMAKVAYGEEKLHDASTDVKILEKLLWKYDNQLVWSLGRLIEIQKRHMAEQDEFLKAKYYKPEKE